MIWEEIIYYAIAAWKLILEDIKVCRFLEVAILLGFDKTWGLGSGALGVVLGWWGGSGP